MTNQHDTALGAEIGDPIVVPASAMNQMIFTVVRYLLVAIAGTLATKGVLGESLADLLIEDSTVQAIVGIVGVALFTAWGALKSRKNVAVQQALEAKLPNNVAYRA